MSKGSAEIRQRARQQALGAARRQRQEQAQRERRLRDLVEQVLTAIGERDAAVAAAELRAGAAVAQMTDVEGLTLAQVVDWCREDLSAREATRLRRLATDADDTTSETTGDTTAETTAETTGETTAETTGETTGETTATVDVPVAPAQRVGRVERVGVAAGQGGGVGAGTAAG